MLTEMQADSGKPSTILYTRQLGILWPKHAPGRVNKTTPGNQYSILVIIYQLDYPAESLPAQSKARRIDFVLGREGCMQTNSTLALTPALSPRRGRTFPRW